MLVMYNVSFRLSVSRSRQPRRHLTNRSPFQRWCVWYACWGRPAGRIPELTGITLNAPHATIACGWRSVVCVCVCVCGWHVVTGVNKNSSPINDTDTRNIDTNIHITHTTHTHTVQASQHDVCMSSRRPLLICQVYKYLEMHPYFEYRPRYLFAISIYKA